ncbi:ATP-binding protein [Actinomadura roseirufa]|uniref:ATP-binding protein n=1 Tax=Actinomadura roseirufa TaxID=2094049 RepID=UPI0010412242|nr:biotin carboxylase N-terminal domain-containing protein [Actinomadura roseirufa]
MFDSVLVANRGEIAVRVFRTLRRLGVRSVAVHTDADAGAPHVRAAGEAVRIPSYLDIEAVVAAALATGARAVHPGYGFLAENTAFARACAAAGLVFVGPPAEAIEAMGDKIRAKRTVAAAGVPVVPGRDEAGLSDAELAAAALEIGLPVLLKPSAGGGGKGMRLVRDAADLPEAIASARREARGSFGDDTLLAERFVENPRHIEIQVFADAHGAAVHLGERECSLQRRHQKIIEEAPSPLLDAAARERMGAAAVAAAKAVGYVGAGTVEYIVSADRPDEFFFMEMNTRLQVEHPVTELVTGLDLVELQLNVAAGRPLPFGQDDVRLDGHAVEARVYAEDPSRGFLPTGGRVLHLAEPAAEHTRVDSGLGPGTEVGGSYDPMLAKVIAWGADRAEAVRRLDAALASYTLLGVPTNVAFLRGLLRHPDVVSGDLDTGLVERALDDLLSGPAVPDEVLAAAALERMLALEGGTDPWDVPDGWRPGAHAWTPWIITPSGGDPVEVRVRGRAASARVAVGDGAPVAAALSAPEGPETLVLTHDGRTVTFTAARDGNTLWLGRGGHAWALGEHVRAEGGATAGAGGDGVLRSPMPGTVLAVKAAEGDRVEEGQPLVVVEAMKMEHTVTAPLAGVVTRLPVRAGAQVALDAVLAVIEEA